MNTARDVLAQQFAMLYAVCRRNLEGMSTADSLVQPPGGGNCANWIVGHLVNVHNAAMQLVGEAPVWEDPQLERAGFEPITGPANAIDWQVMVTQFLESESRCVAAIGRLSDTALAEPMDDPFGRPSTRAGILTILAFHQTYHAGQLAMARRGAGLDGVIKGPGQA